LSRLRTAAGAAILASSVSVRPGVVGAGESEQAQPGAVADEPAVSTVLHDDDVRGGFDDPAQALFAFPAGQAHTLVDELLLLLGDDLAQEGDVASFQAGHDIVLREHAHQAVALRITSRWRMPACCMAWAADQTEVPRSGRLMGLWVITSDRVISADPRIA
jgi:hypothetical protein